MSWYSTRPAIQSAVDAIETALPASPANAATVEQCIAKSGGTVTNASDALFTVAGGPILVTEFVGIVTDTIGNDVTTCQIKATPTAPGNAVNLSTAVNIETDAIGTSYTFTAATPGVLTPTANGAIDQLPKNYWLVPIGTIDAFYSATTTGTIVWYMVYKPLSPDCVVAAAA